MRLAALIKFAKGNWQLLVVLILVALLFGMRLRIDALNADIGQYQKDNDELSTALTGRDETINALKGAVDADRRATEEQLKIEKQKRAKADAENRTLRDALEHSGCNNQRLPDDALRILRGTTKTSPASSETDLRVPANGATPTI
ncbi:DUF2570 family protein [Serratia fonticola]|uniref:DUF2570 family protein n=1 Tax=Serratia fonticola TaxID=47917 RepID=UPI00137898EB|nr:DUF2570 family protein [Serratia fonticola]NCG50740.1 DUF2570 domain-containing protein [Serratia fonticola]